uniref:Uncharacterized protein n=1 Tax=Meloidogyne enterolobii TaxID=390850 RepID=A0A6V7X255_MELEN|nr:unnamed protein product [Meloidogyne enterolobii]
MQQIFYLIVYFILIPFTNSIRCFECSSVATGGDRICSKYVGTSCSYGFFGCVKVATYVGNFINDPTAIVSIVRGCNILPLGGVDACQQQVILGYRIITCFCYSDYCNGTKQNNLRITTILIFILFFVLFNIFIL